MNAQEVQSWNYCHLLESKLNAYTVRFTQMEVQIKQQAKELSNLNAQLRKLSQRLDTDSEESGVDDSISSIDERPARAVQVPMVLVAAQSAEDSSN